MSDNQYDAIIRSAADRYGVPFAMVKAVIKSESNFNPKADSGFSVGLMQVSPSTAGLTTQQLLDPATNVMAGTRYLGQCFSGRGTWSMAISQYNGGYRPGLGYGAPYNGTKPIQVCNAWKPGAPTTGRVISRDCLPGNIVTVQPGQLANQKYVDKVLQWYGVYAQEGTTTPSTPMVALPIGAAPPPSATPKVIAIVLGVIGAILGLGRLRGRR